MTQQLIRTGTSTYRFGDYVVTGMCITSSGRTGSRINRWLVECDGRIVATFPTLGRVRDHLAGR